MKISDYRLQRAHTETKELLSVMRSAVELLALVEMKLIFLESYVMTMEEYDPNFTDEELDKMILDREEINKEIEAKVDLGGN